MSSLASRKAALFGQSEDPVIVAWRKQVQADGGTVSEPYAVAATRLVRALRVAGIWDLMPDFASFRCENSFQASRSWKRLKAITNHGAVFIPFAGWSTNGSSTYLDTGFTPSTDAGALMGNQNQGVFIWENLHVATTTYAIAGGSTRNLYLCPGSGGLQISVRLSSGDTTGPSITDSRELTTTQRDATDTATFYKKGVSVGTAAVSVPNTGLADLSLFIGCRNNAGTAANFRANVFAAWGVHGLLTATQEAAKYAALQAFHLVVTPPDVYVDGTSGSNSNPGTQASPVQTIDAGIGATIPRARVLLNGSNTYTLSTNTTLTQNITIQGSGSAVLAGTGTGQVFIYSPLNGEALTLNNAILDPSLNTSGPAGSAIQLGNQSNAYGLILNGCTIQNWTLNSIFDNVNKSNVVLNNTNFTNGSTASGGALQISHITAGSLNINGGTTTIPNLKGSGTYALGFLPTAAGVTCSVVGHTVVATLGSTNVSSSYALFVAGVANTLISGGSYTLNDAGSSAAIGNCVGVALNGGTLPISGSVIDGVTASCDAHGGGLGIYANLDQTSQDTTKADSITIRNCTFTGGSNFAAGAGHDIFFCYTQNSLGYNNAAIGGGYNLLLKATKNTWHRNSTGRSATNCHAPIKGITGGGFDSCTFTADTTNPSSGMMEIETNADTGGVDCSGVQINNNTFIVDGATSVVFVVVADANQGVTFSGNTYQVKSGSAAALPFNWQGTAVSKAYWLANVEPNAVCIGF